MTGTETILDAAGLRVGEATAVTGGPPCQGFSTSGKRDPNDDRNDLVFHFLRVVREAMPKFFIMENVPGFVSLNKHEYLKRFLETAHGGFYELVYGLVDAVEHGVPQYRCRFFCMGTRRDLVHSEGILGSLPKPQNFHDRDLKRFIDLDKAPLFTAPELRVPRTPHLAHTALAERGEDFVTAELGAGVHGLSDETRRFNCSTQFRTMLICPGELFGIIRKYWLSRDTS